MRTRTADRRPPRTLARSSTSALVSTALRDGPLRPTPNHPSSEGPRSFFTSTQSPRSFPPLLRTHTRFSPRRRNRHPFVPRPFSPASKALQALRLCSRRHPSSRGSMKDPRSFSISTPNPPSAAAQPFPLEICHRRKGSSNRRPSRLSAAGVRSGQSRRNRTFRTVVHARTRYPV